jgi:hypothetical protein
MFLQLFRAIVCEFVDRYFCISISHTFSNRVHCCKQLGVWVTRDLELREGCRGGVVGFGVGEREVILSML